MFNTPTGHVPACQLLGLLHLCQHSHTHHLFCKKLGMKLVGTSMQSRLSLTKVQLNHFLKGKTKKDGGSSRYGDKLLLIGTKKTACMELRVRDSQRVHMCTVDRLGLARRNPSR